MRLLYMLSLFCLGYYIADAASILKNLEDEPASASESGNSPDLLQMLNAMQGKSSLQKISTFLNDFKIGRQIIKSFVDNYPLGKKILESASKRNIKAKVLMDVINGHFPDLHDIYRFATDHNDSFVNTMVNTMNTNPDYQTLKTLARRKADPEKQIFLLTGKKVDLKPSLINEVKTGTYKLSPENVNQVNLLEMMAFFDDNVDLRLHFIDENSDVVQSLQFYIQRLNTAHLAKIVSPRTGMSNTKYTVTGRSQKMVQDPDVTIILQDLKAVGQLSDNPKDLSKAKTLWLDMWTRGFKLFNTLMTKASNGASSDDLNKATENSANMG